MFSECFMEDLAFNLNLDIDNYRFISCKQFYAAEIERVDIIEYLISRGAEIKHEDNEGVFFILVF